MLRRKVGMTLLELVVSCTLVSLATAVMASSFTFFTRSGLRYEQRQQMLTIGEKALLRVLNQVSLTDSTAVYTTTGATVGLPSSILIVYFPIPELMSQNSVRFDSTGNPLWQSWEGFEWVPSTGVLYEGRQNCTATNSLTSLVSPIASLTTWSIVPIAQLVTGFSFSGPTSDTFTLSLTLTDSQGYQVQLASSAVAQN